MITRYKYMLVDMYFNYMYVTTYTNLAIMHPLYTNQYIYRLYPKESLSTAFRTCWVRNSEIVCFVF